MKLTARIPGPIAFPAPGSGDEVIEPGAIDDPTGQSITVRAGGSAVTGVVESWEPAPDGFGHLVTLNLPELTPDLHVAFGGHPAERSSRPGRGRHSG